MINKNVLYKLYIEENLGQQKIAKKFKTSVRKIRQALIDYNIPIRHKKQLEDLIGQTFGQLKVISLAHTDNGRAHWNCKCRCGNETIVAATSLKNDLTKSCGCINRCGSYNYEDLSGQTFDRLTVLHRIQVKKGKTTEFLCKCECGNEVVRRAVNLKRCINNKCSNCPKKPYQPSTRTYQEIPGELWKKIKDGAIRRHLKFEISIEEAWNLFLKQERKCALTQLDISFVTDSYHKDYKLNTASLDRIDSSKGYTIDNIQWVHKDINRMKWAFQQDYFINMCKLVAKNES